MRVLTPARATRHAGERASGQAQPRWRAACLALLFAVRPAAGMTSAYDAALPELRLGHVRVEASDLPQAWKTIATDLLVRSVLAYEEDTAVDGRFAFAAEQPRGRDLFDALTAAYPAFRWTQDPRTGVVWLLPRTVPYETILPATVDVPSSQPGLAMQSGILDALAATPALAVDTAHWDGPFQNTFDYPVDVPRGRHAVRDLLNQACAANPTKTFLVRRLRERTFVTAVNLVPEGPAIPPGAVHLWNAATGRPGGQPPADAEVVAAAGDPDPRMRRAARGWLEARAWSLPLDPLVRDAAPAERALWLALAVTSVFVRSPGATRVAVVERMRREATPAFLATGDPALAVLTAVELARVAGDLGPLETVSHRRIPRGALATAADDLMRSARAAPEAAQAIVRANAGRWLGPAATVLPPSGTSWRRLRFALVPGAFGGRPRP